MTIWSGRVPLVKTLLPARFSLQLLPILLLGLILRVIALAAPDLWLDEAISYYLSRQSIPQILHYTATHAFEHPPGYYLFLHAWMALGGTSEFWLRYLAAVGGVLGIALVATLAGRWFDRRVAVLAAFLMAIQPMIVQAAPRSAHVRLDNGPGAPGRLCVRARLHPQPLARLGCVPGVDGALRRVSLSGRVSAGRLCGVPDRALAAPGARAQPGRSDAGRRFRAGLPGRINPSRPAPDFARGSWRRLRDGASAGHGRRGLHELGPGQSSFQPLGAARFGPGRPYLAVDADWHLRPGPAAPLGTRPTALAPYLPDLGAAGRPGAGVCLAESSLLSLDAGRLCHGHRPGDQRPLATLAPGGGGRAGGLVGRQPGRALPGQHRGATRVRPRRSPI